MSATASAFVPPTDLTRRILAYLEERSVMALATDGPGGLGVAPVMYVNFGTDLYFTSVATTRHAQNLAANGRAAGAICDECWDYMAMKGLQLDGKVVLVEDVELRRKVVAAYLRKYPFAAGLWQGEQDPEVIARAPGVHDFYRLTPVRLMFTDHEHKPGVREELPTG